MRSQPFHSPPQPVAPLLDTTKPIHPRDPPDPPRRENTLVPRTQETAQVVHLAPWTATSRGFLFLPTPATSSPHLLYRSTLPLIPSRPFDFSGMSQGTKESNGMTMVLAVSFSFTTHMDADDEPFGSGWEALERFGIDEERVRRGEGDFGTSLEAEGEAEERGEPIVWPDWRTAVWVLSDGGRREVAVGDGETVMDWEAGKSRWIL
ncbi:hypothetical protein BT69DRAFT_1287870 [Atractiella rhizophila]|nr:hypothetical protein BT69DRAFT_1287870 [Atractiella rhizophila]